MIQDIYPHKLDNHFDTDAKPDNDSIVLYFTKEGILHKLSSYKDYEKLSLFPYRSGFYNKDGTFSFEKNALTYLFSVDDAHYFLLEQEPTQSSKKALPLPQSVIFAKKMSTQSTVFLRVSQAFSFVTGIKTIVFADAAEIKLSALLQNEL